MSEADIKKYFENPLHNCIVMGVPKEWDHKDLYDYFSQFGEMYSVKVSFSYIWHGKREDFIGKLIENNQGSTSAYDAWKETEYEKEHNGYGYASFVNQRDQRDCLENYKTRILPNIQTPQGDPTGKKKEFKIMQFDLSVKERQKEIAQQNIFVKGFPIDWGDDQLKELFCKHGDIQSIFVQRDKNGHSLRNGVILFKHKQQAEKAIENLNGLKLPGLEEPLYVGELIPQ